MFIIDIGVGVPTVPWMYLVTFYCLPAKKIVWTPIFFEIAMPLTTQQAGQLHSKFRYNQTEDVAQ